MYVLFVFRIYCIFVFEFSFYQYQKNGYRIFESRQGIHKINLISQILMWFVSLVLVKSRCFSCLSTILSLSYRDGNYIIKLYLVQGTLLFGCCRQLAVHLSNVIIIASRLRKNFFHNVIINCKYYKLLRKSKLLSLIILPLYLLKRILSGAFRRMSV